LICFSVLEKHLYTTSGRIIIGEILDKKKMRKYLPLILVLMYITVIFASSSFTIGCGGGCGGEEGEEGEGGGCDCGSSECGEEGGGCGSCGNCNEEEADCEEEEADTKGQTSPQGQGGQATTQPPSTTTSEQQL